MAKTKISQYDATAANNTDIDSINIAEGMAPSNVNNAIRELMAHLKDMDAGTQALTSPQLTSADINGGTLDGVTIGGASAGAGTFTNLTATGTTTLAGASTSADITFGDNDKAIFGAGSDLQIFSEGSGGNSFINETGNGSLFINASNLYLRKGEAAFENFIACTANGDVKLYHDNAPKLATTSTGVDITGTLTSDGLTVDSVDINGTTVAWQNSGTNQTYFATSGSSEQALILRLDNQDLSATGYFEVQDGSAGRKLLTVEDGGDISFYEDTGTTAKFFWDASAESLGIGTSSPANLLHIRGGAATLEIDSSTNTANLDFDNSTQTARIQLANNDLTTLVGGSERMRILSDGSCRWTPDGTNPDMTLDASGNLLVGKTSSSILTAGLTIDANGILKPTSDGTIGMLMNRKNSDGNIIEFRKDNTTVGNIRSVAGAYMALGKGNTGLLFQDGLNEITPYDISDGANEDAAINLGKSNARFKDLFLSGGVYLGGTGSANKLDDYEEGNFGAVITPSTSGSVTLNSSFNSLSYVKIGNLVTVSGLMIISSVSSPTGYFKIDMPFTSVSTTDRGSDASGSIIVHSVVSANVADFVAYITSNQSHLAVYLGDSSVYASDSAQQLGSGTQITFSVTYRTS